MRWGVCGGRNKGLGGVLFDLNGSCGIYTSNSGLYIEYFIRLNNVPIGQVPLSPFYRLEN